MARWHHVRDFERTEFEHDGRKHAVFRKGAGPGVVVMPELPGPHPQVLDFARHVARGGFTAVVPEIIGKMGRPATPGYFVRSWVRMCISREFRVLSARQSSPIAGWLRALCRALHEELGGPGVGAVGMCLSGNFVLAMMMEPSLLAPVLSQPSLPLPLTASRRSALHLSPTETENLRQRACAGDRVLALRFSEDPLAPPERFKALSEVMGSRLETIEVDSDSARPAQSPWGPHSVLAGDLIDDDGHPTLAARARVISFLRSQLSSEQRVSRS